MPIDPRSDALALVYRGDASGQPGLNAVPARDLSEADLARLAYADPRSRAAEAAEAEAAERGEPYEGPGPVTTDTIRAEVIASGLYAEPAKSKPAKPTEVPIDG